MVRPTFSKLIGRPPTHGAAIAAIAAYATPALRCVAHAVAPGVSRSNDAPLQLVVAATAATAVSCPYLGGSDGLGD